MDIVGEAYRQLSPHVRLALLRTFVPNLDTAPDNLGALPVRPAIRDRIEASLETIAILADESASTLVKLALSDYGLDGDSFTAFASRHDMAASLWIRSPEHATQAHRWVVFNIEVRRRARIEAFQIPRGVSLALPDKKGEKRLQALIEQVLLDTLQSKDIRLFSVTSRVSPWPNEQTRNVLQIDIKRSLDPEKVELDEDGTVLVRSLRYTADIVLVFDPDRGVVYVRSKQNPRKLRKQLAMAAIQHFLGESATPSQAPKAMVHPDKLARQPKFEPVRPDLLSDVTVCELDYRDIAEPGVKRSVVSEDQDTDLYALSDFARASAGRHIYRAALWFHVRGRDGEIHPKKAFLESPNTLSLPHFNWREQDAVEQFLIRNGLLDPSPYQGQAGPFDILAQVTSDIHAPRILAALGQKWVVALTAIGALTSGLLANDVYCEHCNRPHSIERDKMRPEELISACPLDPSPVLEHDRQTLRFLPSRLARWLAAALGTGVANPSEIYPGIWDLGMTAPAGKQGRISLVLVTTLADDERLKAVADRLGLSATRPRGLVLSLSSQHLGLRLRNGWKVAALSGLVDVEHDALLVPEDGPSLLMSGRQTRKAASRKRRWADLFTAYGKIRNRGLGPYEVADALLALPKSDWPWSRDTIARKLKATFPEDFTPD